MNGIEVFWGEESQVKSEKQFLAQLTADLNRAGVPALILANFFTGSSSRQVDFLIITDRRVCHVELKAYNGAIFGTTNGPWSSQDTSGELVEIDRQNPYTQALGCKIAISDDMHALVDQDPSIPKPSQGKFYTHFDSVICIFPRLANESQVPADYKVQTLGYSDFLRLILTPGKNTGWNRDHWLALVRRLALTNVAKGNQERLPADAAQQLVADYCQKLAGFYRRDLHELVPLPLKLDGVIIPSEQLPVTLRDSVHTQLIGPSGCGKSHLTKHAMLTVLDSDCVVVFIEAGMYEGRLSTLLNRSVARFSTASVEELLQAAAINGQTVLLIVDGYNECPQNLRDRLTGDLSALCLRFPLLTLLTCQSEIPLSGVLDSKVIRVGDLDEEHRKAVLSSYGAPEIVRLCAPFATAYELSIAAECASEMESEATRANLFAAFIRKRLAPITSPAFTRDVLRKVALVMNDRLTTSLPLDEVWTIAEQHAGDRSAPVSAIDDVLACTVVITQQGRFSFTHELLGRFLTTEGLRLQHRTPALLARELKKPRHQDLLQLAVELERDVSRLDQLLAGLADSRLYVITLQGAIGTGAARATQSAARKLLRVITQGMASARFKVHSQFELEVTGGYELSETDRSLLSAIGVLVFQGHFLHEVTALLDATDAACGRPLEVQARDEEQRPSISAIVSAALVGINSGSRKIAATIILEACRHARHDRGLGSLNNTMQVSVEDLSVLLRDSTSKSYSRLLLLCNLLQATDAYDVAILGPRVLRLSWESRAYHVQLEGLQTIQIFAKRVEGNALHDEIVGILETLNTNNIMMSTQLVETLFSYGLIEPPGEMTYIQEQINEILQGSGTPEQRELAYGIVSSQFEDVIAQPYFEAIEALTPEQRVLLYTSAALGARSDGFWADWLLKQLIAFADERALPAFERWATQLDADNPFIQQTFSCYVLAVEGCALFMERPPELECRTDDELAWQHYGAIMFWMHRASESDTATISQCASSWGELRGRLIRAAADPFYWLAQPSVAYALDGPPIIGQMTRLFPDEMRSILEWGLRYPESMTSITRRALPDRLHRIMHILALVGDDGTVELLRQYVDDPALGKSAIEAIKKLTTV